MMLKFFISTNRSLWGKLLRLPLKLIPRNATVRILGGPIKGLKWVVGSFNHGCWIGTYEAQKVQTYVTYLGKLPAHSVIYDCGSHVGYYSLISATHNSTFRVHCFEPLEKNIAYLQEHIRLNTISNIEVHPWATGKSNATVYFQSGESSSTGKISSQGKIPTQQVSLDSCIESKLFPPPNLIKMDIEGAEYETLLGAKSLIQCYKPIIFLATHGTSVHQQCLQLLEELGYRITSIDAKDPALSDELLCVPSLAHGTLKKTG